MKLHSYTMERRGQLAVLKASWADRMRRPSSVTLSIQKNVGHSDPTTMIEGDPADVSHVINEIAGIAWGLGWRPPGLAQALVTTVDQYAKKGT